MRDPIDPVREIVSQSVSQSVIEMNNFKFLTAYMRSGSSALACIRVHAKAELYSYTERLTEDLTSTSAGPASCSHFSFLFFLLIRKGT